MSSVCSAALRSRPRAARENDALIEDRVRVEFVLLRHVLIAGRAAYSGIASSVSMRELSQTTMRSAKRSLPPSSRTRSR